MFSRPRALFPALSPAACQDMSRNRDIAPFVEVRRPSASELRSPAIAPFGGWL